MANAGVVYAREYRGKKLNFEASGGLIHASLIMQDRETDSYWSIMRGEAIAGRMSGERLAELPIGKKMRWKEWVREHPQTLVLSVGGREHRPGSAYQGYFRSAAGFRGIEASDRRLPTKAPVYAFHLDGTSYAVTHKVIEGGKQFDFGTTKFLLYRRPGASMFESTLAFRSSGAGFVHRGDSWSSSETGCKLDLEQGGFQAARGPCPEPAQGFDTFWYNWSLSNPDTKLLQ